MSLRTPLSRVRGLGSAKSGTDHWLLQRLTAIVHGSQATPAQATILWAHVHGLAGLMLAAASGWALAHGIATAMGSDFCLPF